MTANEMHIRFNLQPCAEGGEFREIYREKPNGVRPPSGVIYYALMPGEYSEFHTIDCDEYWLYHTGGTLEIWIIDSDGNIRKELLGMEERAQPCIFIKRGSIFGARHVRTSSEGTLLSCVTVPQFMYEGFTLFTKEEMLKKYPEVKEFYSE